MFKNDRVLSIVAATILCLSSAHAASTPFVSPAILTAALHWRSVGPYVGGRVTAVAGLAHEPTIYYMGAASGGVWKTDDAGYHWKNISDRSFKTNNIGAIAVAPSNPNIVYVGAGDASDRNTIQTTDGVDGGVYKSTDAGKTWTQVGLEKTQSISWICVDPRNPDVVYVAAFGDPFAPSTHRGVYKTTNGGKTWKQVLYVNDQTAAVSLAMDPHNPQLIYASMWQVSRHPWALSSGGPGSGLYKTTDGGAHWSNISHHPGLPHGILGNIGVALAPSNPNVVYTIMQAKYRPGHPGGLFKSVNGGQTWTEMNDSLDITQRLWYFGNLYVDPQDPNTIYVPNVRLFVSHDSGKTLTELHPPHGDNHVFWINPDHPQDFIEGNDGGATVTLNGGQTWSTEDNQPTGQFYHVNLDDQFPFHIYGAQQDEGSSEGPSAVTFGRIPAVWRRVAGGEDCQVVPVPGKPWITFSCGEFSVIRKGNRRTGEVDEVSPWPDDKNGSAGYEMKYRWGWTHRPAAFSPVNPKEFILGANVLFKTVDEGVNWTKISPDLTRNDKSKQRRSGGPIAKDQTGEEMYDTITAIGLSPLSDQIIWAGSDDGLVHVTTDGGKIWSAVRPPSLPKWAIITCIEPSHTQEGTAYLSASRYMWDDWKPYVYQTTDFGKHWTKITTGLPNNQYIESVRQDPSDPELLLAGSNQTVYMSINGGQRWSPLRLNLPLVRVEDIAFQPEQHAVVLATFGRGYWVLDNLQFLEQATQAHVTRKVPYLFKPQQTWLVKRRVFSFFGHAGGENLAPGANVFFYLPATYTAGDKVKLSFTTADGKLIRSFTLPFHVLKTRNSNRSIHPSEPKQLHAGVVNRFLWNLHYPDAVDVHGILWTYNGASEPVGPQVVPGTYYAVLSYDGHTQRQRFTVKLDPRLHTSQAALKQRFDLMMRIHRALNRLDTTLNHALTTRHALGDAIAAKRVRGEAAQQAYERLRQDIDHLVNLKIQSNEGGLMFRARLHAWLTNIDQAVNQEYRAPTPSMVQVADEYMREARAGVTRLKAAIAEARRQLTR